MLAATVRLGPPAGMEEAEEQTPVGQVHTSKTHDTQVTPVRCCTCEHLPC